MFKVSTKGDYGLLLMTTLALAHREKYVSLGAIAEAKKISLPYLGQIIGKLKKAGLVESKEGTSGGYRLSRIPREISVMEILEALEGPVAPVKCLKGKSCRCETGCTVKNTWSSAQNMLRSFFQNKSLHDLISNS